MHEQGRTDHLGYIKAVVRDLESLGIETGRLRNMATWTIVKDDDSGFCYSTAPREPRRATGMSIPQWDHWPWFEPVDVSAGLAWHEEFGWIVDKTSEINAGPYRGRWDTLYGLDLGLVPDPVEVASRIETVFTTKDLRFNTRPYQLRKAADYDPDLETALAAYLPA
jgi:hypothetical protein